MNKNNPSQAVAPRWQLSSVFPSISSPEFEAALNELSSLLGELKDLAEAPSEPDDTAPCAEWFSRVITTRDAYLSLAETVHSYCYASYSVDTASSEALSAMSRAEAVRQPYEGIFAKLLNELSLRAETLRALCSTADFAQYKDCLEELIFMASKRMSPAEEDLAADLARFGCEAWSRLQDKLTSSASCVWDDATGETKTLVELRSLAYDPDRNIRKKAFFLELDLCRAASESCAAALNSIKGASVILNKRRGWKGFEGSGLVAGCPSLEKSAWQGKVSRAGLEALIAAMEDAVPVFARYLNLKARLLGAEKCAFFDLFAPISAPETQRRFTWSEAADAVCECFEGFSGEMADFARRAFAQKWIDGEMRAGKIGGAYMTAFPSVKESRVMCNFDGTFNSVMTLAHELGHAWHFEVMKDLPAFEQDLPMTLAETASIFAETLVFNSFLETAPKEEKAVFIEMNLQDGCQIICDILSRFYCERAAFAKPENETASVADFCAWMEDAQRKAYGGALDENYLHPYMWLVKSHYYSADLAFYNFPYAFGQLFSLALFARFRSEGSSFAPVYKSLLLNSGRKTANETAREAGFDIEDPAFWKSGTEFFKEEAERLKALFQNGTKADKIGGA